jgi:hypothetical protein
VAWRLTFVRKYLVAVCACCSFARLSPSSCVHQRAWCRIFPVPSEFTALKKLPDSFRGNWHDIFFNNELFVWGCFVFFVSSFSGPQAHTCFYTIFFLKKSAVTEYGNFTVGVASSTYIIHYISLWLGRLSLPFVCPGVEIFEEENEVERTVW